MFSLKPPRHISTLPRTTGLMLRLSDSFVGLRKLGHLLVSATVREKSYFVRWKSMIRPVERNSSKVLP
jgi:hypothetical protein